MISSNFIANIFVVNNRINRLYIINPDLRNIRMDGWELVHPQSTTRERRNEDQARVIKHFANEAKTNPEKIITVLLSEGAMHACVTQILKLAPCVILRHYEPYYTNNFTENFELNENNYKRVPVRAFFSNFLNTWEIYKEIILKYSSITFIPQELKEYLLKKKGDIMQEIRDNPGYRKEILRYCEIKTDNL